MKKILYVSLLALGLIAFPHDSHAAITVDTLLYNNSWGEIENGRFFVFGRFPSEHRLSNGAWGETGAGGMTYGTTTSTHFERDGADINYFLDEPSSFSGPAGRHFMMAVGLLDLSNNWLGQFSLQVNNASPLILRAQYGTRNATISGLLTVTEAESWWVSHPSDFHPTSGYGSVVPFSLDYELFAGSVWDENTFNGNPSFDIRGQIDFSAAPVVTPEPQPIVLMLIGGLAMLFFRYRKVAAA